MSVYFAEAAGYIKIGYSKNPAQRIGTVTINGTRPDDLPRGAECELIGWIPGDRAAEAEFHKRYSDNRVAGEWFRGLDRAELESIIWADPRGVHMLGMSAMAVYTCIDHPELTRDEVAAMGIRVDAATLEEALESIDAIFRGCFTSSEEVAS